MSGYCDGLLALDCDCPWEERGFGLRTVRTTFHKEDCVRLPHQKAAAPVSQGHHAAGFPGHSLERSFSGRPGQILSKAAVPSVRTTPEATR